MQLPSKQPMILLPHAVSVAFTLDVPHFSAAELLALGISIPPLWQQATPARQRDFVAGRYAAKQALLAVGVVDSQIGIDQHRAPIWPQGTVGSITHAGDYVAATIGPSETFESIGIDTEIILSEDNCESLRHLIMTKFERENAGSWGLSTSTTTTLVFSAKESIYKCLFPLVLEFFDFLDVEIYHIDVLKKSFAFRILRGFKTEVNFGKCYQGIFTIDDMFVHTAVVFSRST